jgi:hypothetical protein
MAKYQCNGGHIFTHPAKEILVVDTTVSSVKELSVFPSKTLETYTCPICRTHVFDEYLVPEADITSVLSCDLGAVDGFLKQGYIVKELYAKTATLIKREVKKEQPDPDDNQAITESNDVTDPFVQQARAYYAKMHPEGQP